MQCSGLTHVWVRGGLVITALSLSAILLHRLLESAGVNLFLLLYPLVCSIAWLYGVKTSQDGVARSQRRYEELAETASLIPWEADINAGTCLYVGPQASEVLGYPLKDWYTPDFWINTLYPEDRAWVIQARAEKSAY